MISDVFALLEKYRMKQVTIFLFVFGSLFSETQPSADDLWWFFSTAQTLRCLFETVATQKLFILTFSHLRGFLPKKSGYRFKLSINLAHDFVTLHGSRIWKFPAWEALRVAQVVDFCENGRLRAVKLWWHKAYGWCSVQSCLQYDQSTKEGRTWDWFSLWCFLMDSTIQLMVNCWF